MSSSAAALRLRRALAADRSRAGPRTLDPAQGSSSLWGLLFLNALTFYPGISFVHIPSVVGKVITQGALVAAFLVALAVNRRHILRPNVFLCLVSLLVIEALITMPIRPAPRYRVPDLPARGLCCHALAADAVVGPARPAAGPLPSEQCFGSARLGAARPPGGPRARPPLRQAQRRGLAHPGHGGRALRGGYDRAGGRALALRPPARPGHPARRRRSGTYADPHAHEDRPGRHGGGPPGRRPEPDRGQGAGAQAVRRRGRRSGDRES